jgi:hypothetical protein
VNRREPHLFRTAGLVCLVFAVASCTINIGGGGGAESSPNTSEVASTPTLDVSAQDAWLNLSESMNALDQGEIAETKDGLFGILAAPTIKLFAYRDMGWVDIGSSTADQLLDPLGVMGIEPGSLDYGVEITSVDLTGDGSVEYIVNYTPAEWDMTDAPNQGRPFGWVLSFDSGEPENLMFWEPYENEEHFAVQYIKYVDGVIFGAWFGSCGRPCGLMIYRWEAANNRLEGVEATEKQESQIPDACIDFNFSVELPVSICDEGQSVSLIQEAVSSAGFSIGIDGYFGESTKLAVQFYQRVKGIRATGIVDWGTWNELFKDAYLPGVDLNGDGVITPEEFGD